jgi:hypothetical protein
LLKRKIASLELRDRDGATSDHRASLVERSPRPLYILERDSIESYLIQPDVIARVVHDTASERGKEVELDSEGITSLIMELAEGMKDETTDRASQRYVDDCNRLGKDRPSVASANEVARAAVGDSWNSLEDRLLVISGKKLLGAIRQRIQDEHGVNFGNERLAEGFTPEEIPQEIKNQLDQIASLSAPENSDESSAASGE